MISSVSFADAVGIIGVGLYLVSYAALQLGVVRGQTYTYAALNAGAAGCVLFSLSETFNLSAALIQVCWIAISLIGIARLAIVYGRAAQIRFAERERRFLAAKLPTLSKPLARRLLGAGRWIDAGPGVVLAREGQPVLELVYLARGRAVVSHGGHAIGACLDDTYIGELTCLSGAPATATVTLDRPCPLLLHRRRSLAPPRRAPPRAAPGPARQLRGRRAQEADRPHRPATPPPTRAGRAHAAGRRGRLSRTWSAGRPLSGRRSTV
jgi:hypothetical protein